MTRERYLIDAYGPDYHAMELALKTCDFLASEHDGTVAMIVDCIDSTMENEPLQKLLGNDAFEAFRENCTTNHRDTELSIFEIDSVPDFGVPKIALLPFCHDSTIARIEQRKDISVIVAFPWRHGDIQDWERKHNPRLVKRNFPAPDVPSNN